jgi:hypothetical protein
MLRPVEIQSTSGGKSSAQVLLSLAVTDVGRARELFPAYRLTQLVSARFDLDEAEAAFFTDLTDASCPTPGLASTALFNDHLRASIERYFLTTLFCDDGPGRHHHAIRPTGYDYYADAVDAEGMEQWRVDYRAMAASRQMFAASIIWLYRGGKDNRWLRRVPCTWHAADAVCEMSWDGVLADWGLLISLYPGW